MKVTIKGIIKESNDNKQRYYDKVSKIIRPPYLRDLISLGVPPDEWKPILSIVFKQPVAISVHSMGDEIKSGYVIDKFTQIIYDEDSNGYYIIREYDKFHNKTYQYRSMDNFWEKSLFNDKGDCIYKSNSKGIIFDLRY
jgi:hypothetical protein